MPWHYIYETAIGRPVSETDIDPAGNVPPSHSVRTRLARMAKNEMWDNATRDIIPRPPKVRIDRLEDFKNDAGFMSVWTTLNSNQKDKLRAALVRILGKSRFRNQDSKPEIGEE